MYFLCTLEMIRITHSSPYFSMYPFRTLEGDYFWGISYDCSTDHARNIKY